MEANLLKNPENKGGLKCLEKQSFPKTKLEDPLIPLVPLNSKQDVPFLQFYQTVQSL